MSVATMNGASAPTTHEPYSTDRWETYASYVLPVLVGEEEATGKQTHYYTALSKGLQLRHFPKGATREIFRALQSLRADGQPVHFTTVTNKLDQPQYDSDVQMMFAGYAPSTKLSLGGKVFEANLIELKRQGDMAYQIYAYEEARRRTEQGEDQAAVTADTMAHIAGSSAYMLSGETAADMAADLTAHLESVPPKTLFTNIKVIDDWNDGVGREEFWSVVAPMKMRKTTLLLNMLLGLLDNGTSCSLFMYESTRRATFTQLVLMLGAKWLWSEGVYNKACDDKHELTTHHLSVKRVLQLGGNIKYLPKIQQEMVNHGKAALAKYSDQLRIYDKTREGGSLATVDDFHRVMLYDKQRYGTEFMGIDHLQRIGAGTDYEIMNVTVPYIENVCRQEHMAICLLSQVKTADSNSSDSTRHDSGATGGNKIDSAIDTMLYTRYRQPKEQGGSERFPETVMTIGVQHNRYGASSRSAQVRIDPWSGVMLEGGKEVEYGHLNEDEDDTPMGEVDLSNL